MSPFSRNAFSSLVYNFSLMHSKAVILLRSSVSFFSFSLSRGLKFIYSFVSFLHILRTVVWNMILISIARSLQNFLCGKLVISSSRHNDPLLKFKLHFKRLSYECWIRILEGELVPTFRLLIGSTCIPSCNNLSHVLILSCITSRRQQLTLETFSGNQPILMPFYNRQRSPNYTPR